MIRVPMILLVVVVIGLGFSTARTSEQVADSYACVLATLPELPFYGSTEVGVSRFALSATNELSYEFYYCAGLEEVAVHIHGPGADGPILFTIPPQDPDGWGFGSGVLGVLTTEQLHDLNCGLWYMDFHSTEFPDGHLRGQIRGNWGWYVPSPCFLATEQSTWGAVKSRYR